MDPVFDDLARAGTIAALAMALFALLGFPGLAFLCGAVTLAILTTLLVREFSATL